MRAVAAPKGVFALRGRMVGGGKPDGVGLAKAYADDLLGHCLVGTFGQRDAEKRTLHEPARCMLDTMEAGRSTRPSELGVGSARPRRCKFVIISESAQNP